MPKYDNSNLNPDYIDQMGQSQGYAYTIQYLMENSELMGSPCKWLDINDNGVASCKVYDYRSLDCRAYPGNDCETGKKKRGLN